MIGLIILMKITHMITSEAATLCMEPCEVGLFRLPGLSLKKTTIPNELQEQMQLWADENKCGTCLTEYLWSFRNEHQRDWFILRWSDELAGLQQ